MSRATPLHLASQHGSKAVAKPLLGAGGAEKEAMETVCMAEPLPLHLASQYGHETVVKLLLQVGAKKRRRATKAAKRHYTWPPTTKTQAPPPHGCSRERALTRTREAVSR